MNVYLDIDGVLLANEKSAANYADEFLQAVLAADVGVDGGIDSGGVVAPSEVVERTRQAFEQLKADGTVKRLLDQIP